jgi:hypothetical protein
MLRPKSSHVFGILRVEKGDRSAGVALFPNLASMTPTILELTKVTVLRARICVDSSELDN